MNRFAVVLAIACLLQNTTMGQANQKATNPSLYKTIAALDSAFFGAYNSCDLKTMDSLLSEDLEFYHDQGGKMDKKAVHEATQKNICGKVQRQLVKETLEIFPIAGFGAIQSGSHRFKNIAQGDKEFGKPARFLHIWQLKDGAWKLYRIVSYDH